MTDRLRWLHTGPVAKRTAGLWANLGRGVEPRHVDFPLALAGLRDVVGGLHPHERVHLHAERFLDSQRHVAGQAGSAVEQTGQSRAGNPKRDGGCRHRQARGFDDLRPDEITGPGGTNEFQIRYHNSLDRSVMELPGAPSTFPFRQWGLVPSVCVVLGIPAALIGIIQEVSLSNRRLMLGATLLFFGFTWHYGRRERMRREVLEVAKCVFFLCLTAAAAYCLIFGNIPILHNQALPR